MLSRSGEVIFPAVNSFAPRRATGRDFLGQQSIIQYMVNRCIPSFTNTTSRLRYYSFWAWAFLMLERNFAAVGQRKAWLYLQKLETALIISNHLRNPGITGMPGIESVSVPDRNAGPSLHVQIYDKRVRKTNSFTPVQYKPSLGSLGIVWRNGNSYVLGRFGRCLSDAFDRGINQARGYAALIDPGAEDLTLGQLLSLESGLSLDNVQPDEQRIFRAVIEQREVPNSGRVATTLLMLDIASRCRVSSASPISALWRGQYQPPPQLQEIAGAWIVIQLRMYYQLSVEALLHSFLRYLEEQPNGAGTYADFSNKVALSFRETPLYSVRAAPEWRFGQLLDSILSNAEDNGIDEESLREAVLLRQVEGSPFAVAQTALALQALLLSRFASLSKYPSAWARRFLAYPSGVKASCVALRRDYDLCLDRTVQDATQHIVTTHILMLHLAVSQAKWVQTGNFTFKFLQGDSSGFVRAPGAAKNNIGMTANKIRAYIFLLCDMGLLSQDGDRIRPTRSGSEYFASTLDHLRAR